jgi:hypothetical protein
MGNPPDYGPRAESSGAAIAAQASYAEKVAYDYLADRRQQRVSDREFQPEAVRPSTLQHQACKAQMANRLY